MGAIIRLLPGFLAPQSRAEATSNKSNTGSARTGLLAMMKEHVVERKTLVAVHQHCPDQAYVQLTLPDDVQSVSYVEFSASSRDQGWCDSNDGPSYTTIDVSVKRPAGRNELRTFSVFTNRRGVPIFEEYRTVWPHTEWRQALQAKDVIQLIPKAYYPGWVNFVRRACIKIGYEPTGEVDLPAQSIQSSNDEFYTRSLDSKTKEIRLLKLHPGNFGDRVECSMHLGQLTKDLMYDALSYCWGDVTSSVDIEMDASDLGGARGTFVVSPSVRGFLQRIRQDDHPLVIWIDQICINQTNQEERALQVSLMAEVYSRAKIVHVWLGEGDPSVHRALRILRDIHNFNSRSCPGGDKCTCEGTPHTLPTTSVDEIIQKKGESSYKAMYEIFQAHKEHFFTIDIVNHAGGVNNEQLSRLMSLVFANPWFRRVWVLQEALRAQNAKVHCGQERVPWEEIVGVSAWLRSDEYQNQQAHLEPLIVMPSIWHYLTSGEGSMNTTPELDQNRQLPILDVFLNGLELKSTDPRDKLFSLYSFSDDARMGDNASVEILPSYTKTSSRVFADFTRWWIRKNHSLSILSTTHGLPGRSWVRTSDVMLEEATQPSWAVGSTGNTKTAYATLEYQFRFHASAGSVPNLALLDHRGNESPETLWLQGFKIAAIEEITYLSLNPNKDVQLQPAEKQLLGTFERLFDPSNKHMFWKSKGIHDHVGDVKQESEAQWDAPGFLDHLGAHWGYPELRTEPFIAVRPEHILDSYPGTRQRTYYLPACLDPFFFIATNPTYGLCPQTAKVGDVIVVFDGASVPYLLRPSQGGSQCSTFELVGECYLMGAMDGTYYQDQIRSGREKDKFALV